MTPRPGFFFCICPDGKLLRQQIAELLAGSSETAWEKHVFWGDEEFPPKFWELLTLQGLFSSHGVLVVRNAEVFLSISGNGSLGFCPVPTRRHGPFFVWREHGKRDSPKFRPPLPNNPVFSLRKKKGGYGARPDWICGRCAGTFRRRPGFRA